MPLGADPGSFRGSEQYGQYLLFGLFTILILSNAFETVTANLAATSVAVTGSGSLSDTSQLYILAFGAIPVLSGLYRTGQKLKSVLDEELVHQLEQRLPSTRGPEGSRRGKPEASDENSSGRERPGEKSNQSSRDATNQENEDKDQDLAID